MHLYAQMTIASLIEITPTLIRQHGMKPDEYDCFITLHRREPTIIELGRVNWMGTVIGKMPYPENMIEPLHGHTDCRPLFEGLLAA